MRAPLPAPGILPGSLIEIPPTAGAVWLEPSAWPATADFLFRPQEPFRAPQQRGGGFSPVVVTQYDRVRDLILDRRGIWQRSIPSWVVPEEDRDCVIDASWMIDGPEHARLRHAISSISLGSANDAREFTRDLTRQLLAALMREKQPWNLVRVIDEVCIRLIIEHTIRAPVLLPHARRIRELARWAPARTDDGTDVMAYFQTPRRRELEDIFGLVADHPDQLHEDGLAWHLATLTQTIDPRSRKPVMTRKQLISQLAMLVISYESAQAMTAGLIGMLFQYGLLDESRQLAATPEGMANLVSEGGRRGLSFPINMLTPKVPVTLGSHAVREGEPVIISYQAANMDETRFGGGAAGFDPRRPRPQHLAFGRGPHLCQGKRIAEQLTADICEVILEAGSLPSGVRLGHDGQILREVASPTWAIADLPITSR